MRERRDGSRADKKRKSRVAAEAELDPDARDGGGDEAHVGANEVAATPGLRSAKVDRARREWWVMAIVGTLVVLAIVIQVVRSGSERKTLEDDQLCTENLATAQARIVASKLDAARDYLSAARVSCGAKRSAEVTAAWAQLNADATAADEAIAQEGAALVKQQRDDAARVWSAYDNLPAANKTELGIFEAMNEAKTHERGLPPNLAQSVATYNQMQARKRMAPLINSASRAEGDRAEILVPSPERAACIVFGSSWSKNVDSLQAIGFEKIRCAASSYKSHLTAEMVVEPERVWAVPKP
jgi:hypothetical protein